MRRYSGLKRHRVYGVIFTTCRLGPHTILIDLGGLQVSKEWTRDEAKSWACGYIMGTCERPIPGGDQPIPANVIDFPEPA